MTNDQEILFCRVKDTYLDKIISAQEGKRHVPLYSIEDILILCDNVVLMARELKTFRAKERERELRIEHN